ncbi:MAG TPA: anthranilate phosphoribosyltransferase [Candidatus Limnocylindrales bacterium]|nr:anthranilate phosphoribosyltransferase [Candidatus Limnocylindrales bacterium]
MKEYLSKLVEGRSLTAAEAEEAMGILMDGKATSAQVGAFLAALQTKGETAEELTGLVRAMRARCTTFEYDGTLVDTCGTGGDGLGTYNVSTAAAFIAAAAGAKVAKHGNRAMSGKVGTADVLEAAGANVELAPEHARRCLDRCGVTFLLAPLYHPSGRNVAPARKEIGIRTAFNLAGPLCNPAGAKRQVLGVFSDTCMHNVAEVLRELGTEHALVVHGCDGSDEITAAGQTKAVELRRGKITPCEITPESFGIARCRPDDLIGGDAAHNAQMLREVLAGKPSAYADAALLNGAAAIYVGGLADSLYAAVTHARRVLQTGKPLQVLESFVRESRAEQ